MHISLQTGSTATFAIGDVLCPDAAEVLRHTGPELKVRGRILYFSDSGLDPDRFAIVEVAGIQMPLIVPVDRLCLVDELSTGASERALARESIAR